MCAARDGRRPRILRLLVARSLVALRLYTARMRQDLRYALRLLRRRPGASALVIAILAIGIAAATIVFSLADAILWHPLPFRDPDRLVRIRATAAAPGAAADIPAALDGSIFESVHPFGLTSTIVSIGGEARGITIGEISPGVLHALGVAPIEGREFAPNEYAGGRTVVIASTIVASSCRRPSPLPTASSQVRPVVQPRQTRSIIFCPPSRRVRGSRQ